MNKKFIMCLLITTTIWTTKLGISHEYSSNTLWHYWPGTIMAFMQTITLSPHILPENITILTLTVINSVDPKWHSRISLTITAPFLEIWTWTVAGKFAYGAPNKLYVRLLEFLKRVTATLNGSPGSRYLPASTRYVL